MAEKTVLIFLILVGMQGSMAVIHSLKYFYTASSEIPNFPSYVSFGFVDEVQISYCDSRTNKNIPKQDWMNQVSSEYPKYWEEETETCLAKQQVLKENLETAQKRFNQTEGVPIFQQMYGCEWDDETGEVKGYDEFDYDGDDLITLDWETQQWIAPNPQAVITKDKWNNNRAIKQLEKFYLTQTCVEWLKKYVNYGRNSLMKTVLPSVFLLQKSPSSPINCFATGFHPNRTEIFWRKDGEEIHDGVEKGEIQPNNDGTFQMNVDIDLSSVPPEDWNKYECVFQLYGVREDLVTKLEKIKIKTNEVNSTSMVNITIVSVINIGFIVVTGLIVTGFILYRKKTERILDANIYSLSSETSSLTSISSDDSKGSTSDKPLLQCKKTTIIIIPPEDLGHQNPRTSKIQVL